MTIFDDTYEKATYPGNGVTKTFPISFDYLTEETVIVFLIDTRLAKTDPGYQIQLVQGDEYEIVAENVETAIAYSDSYLIGLERVTPLTQGSEYKDFVTKPASTQEGSLDKLTNQNQEQQTQFNYCLQYSIADTGASNLMPSPIANTVVGYDANKVLSAIALNDFSGLKILNPAPKTFLERNSNGEYNSVSADYIATEMDADIIANNMDADIILNNATYATPQEAIDGVVASIPVDPISLKSAIDEAVSLIPWPYNYINGAIANSNITNPDTQIDLTPLKCRGTLDKIDIDYNSETIDMVSNFVEYNGETSSSADSSYSAYIINSGGTLNQYVIINNDAIDPVAWELNEWIRLKADAVTAIETYTSLVLNDYRRVVSFITDISSKLIPFTSKGEAGALNLTYKESRLDVPVMTSAYASYKLSIPENILLDVQWFVYASASNTVDTFVFCKDKTNVDKYLSGGIFGAGGGRAMGTNICIQTDTRAILLKAEAPSVSVFRTFGYKDWRQD